MRILNYLFIPIDYAGIVFLRYVYLLVGVVGLLFRAYGATFAGNANWYWIMRETLQQIYFTAIQSLGVITLLGLFSGSLVLFQATFQFSVMASYEMMGQFLVVTIIREGAPLLTAMVVVARSATAITSQLGNMRINGEIEALKSIGVHPYAFLVFPRIFGGTSAILALAFYFAIVAVLGGYMLTSFAHEISPIYYITLLLESLRMFENWWLFIFKVTVDGTLIFAIACYFGMNAKRDYIEVSRATTSVVMRCLVYVLVFNISSSILFYAISTKTGGIG